ncbi:MAG: DUF4056 domain-containing protein [Saprospiraceae bacterium]|nr:DUF4056 domain-containing protein [Saprospiraceae bacterium]
MKNIIFFLLLPLSLFGKSPELSDIDLKSAPPKIIRTCCSFGHEVKMFALSFIKFTDITSYDQLGSHKYLGDKAEMNGIIYTQHGGFVDIAHVRDVADWTAYVYNLINKAQKEENPHFELKLGKEGGTKKLILKIPKEFTDDDAIILAGKIAYDISVWHEIATWYGNSFLPFISEGYSAFSVEDAYSNLMGAHVGMEAIRSDLPYNDAVTKILNKKLLQLIPVENMDETAAAMNAVKDIWWTDKAYMPSGKVLLKREFVVYGDSLYPRLLPDMSTLHRKGLPIYTKTAKGQDLNDFYDIKIKLNLRFPYKKIFLNSPDSDDGNKDKTITQRDFQTLISYGTSENRKKYPIDKYQFE